MGRFKNSDQKQNKKRFNVSQTSRPSTQRFHPKFSFEYVQKSHCVSYCTQEEKAALIERLHKLSQLTWQKIMQADKHGQGCEVIPRHSIKTSIPACITEDINVLAFRFKAKAPMVGFRHDEVFFIVWLDRAFTLYKH